MSRRFAEIESDVLQWATDKGLLANPNPMGLMDKCLEEIGEAWEAMPSGYDAREFGSPAHIHAATELGDGFVTLVVISALHGMSLSEVVKAGHAFEFTPIWEDVFGWADSLEEVVSFGTGMDLKLAIAGVYHCLADAAQTRLARLPAECLELAYQKIKNRKGRLINGVYVKEEDLPVEPSTIAAPQIPV